MYHGGTSRTSTGDGVLVTNIHFLQYGFDSSSGPVEAMVLISTFSFLKRRVTWDNPANLPSGNGGCLQPRANLPEEVEG